MLSCDLSWVSLKNYLLIQVDNSEGADKKFYNPYVWVCEGEKMLSAQVKEACSDLGNVNRLSRKCLDNLETRFEDLLRAM
ncbi:hypothetical protein BDR07DRAFT_1492908 [Suillus spraguei]|nr:hypothetical protein BDR07DRAFT_1492908 [Suillus spraguei]